MDEELVREFWRLITNYITEEGVGLRKDELHKK
jgi:hypothetical protein